MDINSDTKKLINKNESYLPSNPRTEEKIKVSSNDTSITAQPLISKRIENKNERPIQNGKKDQLTTKNYKNDIDAFAPPKENF